MDGPDTRWDFFLAYAREDEPSAQDLYERLSARCRVFMDRHSFELGLPWDTAAIEALAGAAAVVPLVSSHWGESWYFREEIARSIGLRKPIIPVLLAADVRRDGSLPYGLEMFPAIVAPQVGGMGEVARLLLGQLRSVAPDPVPRPAAPRDVARHRLFGRTKEIRAVLEHLESPRRDRSIVSIAGLGGVGKTALAEEIFHQLRSSGPFAHLLWETAKTEVFAGSGTVRIPGVPITLQRLLSAIAREGGFAADLEAQPTLADKILLARTHLEQERYLVIIDNLETVQGYRHLISDIRPLFAFSQAIVTTRFSLVEYDFVRSIPLRGLAARASLEFLRHEITDRSPLEDFSLDQGDLLEIHRATGGLPLAMKLVVGRLLATGGAPLGQLLDPLRDIDWSNEQSIYQQFYQFIYHDVWAALSPPARELLIALSVLPPEQPASREEVREVSGQNEPAFSGALEELLRASLVQPSGRVPHFALHPLTRHFVAHFVAGA